MAFGLLNTDTTVGVKSIKSRRKIFWQFPNGAAPLMGLLSMLPNMPTDKSEFGWFEKRFPQQRTTTAASGTAPFLNGDGTALADLGTLTENTEYRVKVVSTAEFKATHVIEIRDLTINNVTTAFYKLQGVVTQVIDATTLKFRPMATTLATVDNNTTDNNGKTVAIIGNANAENARSGQGLVFFPIEPTNYTQIFRAAFNISRTALKEGLTFDKNGPYGIMVKDNGMRYMMEMEKAFLWQRKQTVNVLDPETGESNPEKKTGGVFHFLEQWEAANSVYRGGAGAAAITSQTDSNKRIIDLQVADNSKLSKSRYEDLIANLFRVTLDQGYEKLGLCGQKYLKTVNSLFEGEVTKEVLFEQEKPQKKKFIVHSHETLNGTVHYKTHPLFTEDPDLEDACLYLDLGGLRYRPLNDSDTEFLAGRQENDRDGRKDEWVGEAGLELNFPESNMLVLNAATRG